MVFETSIGLTVKEILEIVIVLLSFAVFYFSYKFIHENIPKVKKFPFQFKAISLGFFIFFISMIFELIDSFYFDLLFDNLQIISNSIALVLLLIGFKDLFTVLKLRGENA